MYLIDTNVLSASAPKQTSAAADLLDWMEQNSPRLYLSVITIAEVEEGIAKARRASAHRKAGHLSAWLETVLHLYSARILPLDIPIARALGGLADQARAQGQTPGFADLTIAATAKTHGYTVLTRNLRHFEPLPINCHNPFETLPP